MRSINLFGEFEIPVIRGCVYLGNEAETAMDYLFVNERRGQFSLYFENGMTSFIIPREGLKNRSYNLFEYHSVNRKIRVFCPEKQKELDSVIWYFEIELLDAAGERHSLPGQITVLCDHDACRCNPPRFVELLKRIELSGAGVCS